MNKETFRLHEIPLNSKIKCECSDGSDYIIYHKPDGLYSFCTSEKGNIMHLHIGTKLVKENDYYVLSIEN